MLNIGYYSLIWEAHRSINSVYVAYFFPLIYVNSPLR
jgi:hypothetical protein